jgi:hypothetical protein
MAAAGRRGIGDVTGAESLEQLAERGGLVADVTAGRVQVEHQHPPGARAGVVHRHRARLARRLRGQPPDRPRWIGAAAVLGDPDMRRGGERSRDSTPGRLRIGA